MKNKWKTATILLSILCVFLLIFHLYQEEKKAEEVLDFGGYKLTNAELKAIKNWADERELNNVSITNIETNQTLKIYFEPFEE